MTVVAVTTKHPPRLHQQQQHHHHRHGSWASGWLSVPLLFLPTGGLNMYLFWEILYVVVTLFCTVIVPFAIFYYEVRPKSYKLPS
jgi:hypothetical protein